MARNKYHAVPTEVDGIRFASKREARRYSELRLLQLAGQIRDLRLQPSFALACNGVHLCNYVADFQYEDLEQARVVVEDAKGVRTPVYKLKKKLLLACYGIEIREV